MITKQQRIAIIAMSISIVAVSTLAIFGRQHLRRPNAFDRPQPDREQERLVSSGADNRSGPNQSQDDGESETGAAGRPAERDSTGDDAGPPATTASDEHDESSVDQGLQRLILDKYGDDINRELEADDFEYLIRIANDEGAMFADRMLALTRLSNRASPTTSPMDKSRLARVRAALRRAMTDDNWYLRHTGVAAFSPNNDLEPDAAAISLIRGLRDDPVDRVAYMANSVVLPGDREKEDGSDGTP